MSSDTMPAAGDLSVLPNAFQQLMLQWERLAPYNAAQYATLADDINQETARIAWRDTSIALGLQQLGQSPDAIVECVAGPIESFVTRELNRPFVPGESPLRPFVHRDPSGQTSAGLFYRHAVADSASIRLLMRSWIERLLGLEIDSAGRRHLRLLRDGGVRLVDSRRRWSILRELAADISRVSRSKRVRRLPATADPTSEVAWRRVEMPAGSVTRLRALAKRESVRVHDLFVAAAAMACDGLVPDEGLELRGDLGIGTIADVRPADRPADRHFGLMLGFLQTVWRRRDLSHWPRVLSVAAGQSRIARERSLAEASVLRLLTAIGLNARSSRQDLANFYRKRCPLAAGISNVNLNRGWPATLHPNPISAYTRISPLGPMLPLVFTPTTLGDSLHLGVTHRTSVLSEGDVDAIVAAFIERLEHESHK
jgi:hypothetical protein